MAVSDAARGVAAELVRVVREATRDLPIDADPASFRAALERLAAPDDEEGGR